MIEYYVCIKLSFLNNELKSYAEIDMIIKAKSLSDSITKALEFWIKKEPDAELESIKSMEKSKYIRRV